MPLKSEMTSLFDSPIGPRKGKANRYGLYLIGAVLKLPQGSL